MDSLAHKVALVTGAGRGIGRAIAVALSRSGAAVAVTGRSMGPLNDTAHAITSAGGRAIALGMDVRAREDVDRVVGEAARALGGEQSPRVDIVVNNAGVSGHTPLDGDDDERFQDILQTNLTGAMFVSRAALRHMPDGGRILGISSVLGKFGVPAYGAYCAAKHGLIGWTRAVALELAPRRITVNAICPGWVETDMASSGIAEIARRAGTSIEAARREAESRVPLERFLEPAEVADLAVYLASPAAAGITAQAISICAGQTAF